MYYNGLATMPLLMWNVKGTQGSSSLAHVERAYFLPVKIGLVGGISLLTSPNSHTEGRISEPTAMN